MTSFGVEFCLLVHFCKEIPSTVFLVNKLLPDCLGPLDLGSLAHFSPYLGRKAQPLLISAF